MLNPFKKHKLKIKTGDKEFSDKKPDIEVTFTHLLPDHKIKQTQYIAMALCPIHSEKTPSFAMYKDTGSYYCFSCQTTGDSYTLIMKLENLNFKEALQYAEDNNLYD